MIQETIFDAVIFLSELKCKIFNKKCSKKSIYRSDFGATDYLNPLPIE